MVGFVKIPTKHFQELEELWTKISQTAVVIDDDGPGPVVIPPLPTSNSIWVDPAHGHDSNDAMSDATPVKSWARVFQMIEPGMTVMLRPGLYKEPIELGNAGTSREKPIVFQSSVPGAAIFDNMIDQNSDVWKAFGNGLYRRSSKGTNPWCGVMDSPGKPVTFLPRYSSLRDLQTRKFDDIRMPKYGFAQEGDILYLRLPGNADPNQEIVRLTKKFGTTFIKLENSPYVYFNGIKFRGHGSGVTISCDEGSHHAWIQNCVSEHGRAGFQISDDTVSTWNQYGYPGFAQFAEDTASLNGGNMASIFHYVKKVNVDPRNRGNALLEGRIHVSLNDRSSRNLQSRYNLCSECWDAHSLGQFEDSSSYRDAAEWVFDDQYEFESWIKEHTGKNLTVLEPFGVNCMVSFSHQDNVGQMEGPHTISKAVSYNPHELITPPYTIKNLTQTRALPPVEATYDRCFFHNPSGPNLWGKKVNFLYLDHKKGEHIDLTIRNSIIWMDRVDDWNKSWNPSMDYNVVVCPTDQPHLRGPNGMWVKTIEALKLVDVENMDFRPTRESPHLATAEGSTAAGPYQFAESLHHRPLETAFTEKAPGEWEN